MKERVTFYIDGFNLYYSLKRMKALDSDWNITYWIDFVKLFQHFIGDTQVLQRVLYFTAPPLRVQKSNRQSLLLEANKLLNGDRFEVIKGMFYEKDYVCPVCNAVSLIPEEKRTDVNISIRMTGDCSLNNTDKLVLVSADSDLVPPLEFIKKYHPDKKINIHFPPGSYSSELYNFMKDERGFMKGGKVRKLEYSRAKFVNSIMPNIVTIEGKSCTIPSQWKK